MKININPLFGPEKLRIYCLLCQLFLSGNFHKRECQLSPGAISAYLFDTLVTGMGTGTICVLGTSTICVLGAGTICVLGAGTMWPQQPGYDALSALPLNGQGLPSSSTSLQPALLSLPSPSPSPNTQIQIQKYK